MRAEKTNVEVRKTRLSADCVDLVWCGTVKKHLSQLLKDIKIENN